jgi:outer membrane protein assembly factor BamD (BamD/ComL family)
MWPTECVFLYEKDNLKIMFKKLLTGVAIAAFLSSCTGSKEPAEMSENERQQQILLLEQTIFDGKNMFNDSAATAVVEAYETYASAFPEDPLAPDYLFKAGEVSMGLGKPLKSMSFFKKVCDLYPNSDKAAYSLFLQAYVLDNHLNDDGRAGELYREFIKKFPDHPMAGDARFSIDHLGKSDEELIREFEKKLSGN